MLSIRKLINQKGESPAPYLQVLLSAISSSAVDSDSGQHAGFQESLRKFAEQIEGAAEPGEIMAHLDAAAELLERYNRGLGKAWQSYRAEFRTMMAMMTDTIGFLNASSRTSVDQLQIIEKNLQAASTAEDLRILRNKLLGCLTLVRNESARMKLESDNMVKSLTAAVVRASAQTVSELGADPSAEPADGSADPAHARRKMELLLQAGQGFSLAVFVLDEIVTLNSRFGRTAGDGALTTLRTHLMKVLNEAGALNRWNGPAFVLISEQSSDGVQALVKRAASTRLDHPVTVDGRASSVTVKFSWVLQEVKSGEPVEAVCRNLDRFVASRTGTSWSSE